MPVADSTFLIVGDVPQYFFDDLVIEQVQDLTRTVHRPEKEPGPLIGKDRPWERVAYFTVNGWSLFRGEDGEFKCWYMNWHVDPEEVKRQQVLYCCFASICYARSTDGLHWEKPDLDYYREAGARTNVVLGNTESFMTLESTHVFEDHVDPDPGRRYKLLLDRLVRAQDRSDEAFQSTRDGRDGMTDRVAVEVHASRDGLSWTPFDEEPRFGRHGNGLGDCYTVYPDPETGLYRLITRAAGMESVHYDARRPRTGSFFPPHFPHDAGRRNKRRIFVTESADLVHWSRPLCILDADAMGLNLDDSLYNMVHYKVGEVYVGLLNVLHEVSNTMDVHLMYSRDGWAWQAASPGMPWLTTTPEAWDRYMVNASSPPVPVGDELFVFHGGASCHHDWWIMGLKEGLSVPEAAGVDAAQYGLGVARMRRDGYVSIDAGAAREGVMVTRALRTESRCLTLNAACRNGGGIEVEVTDADDQVLEGFARADCERFTGDSTDATMAWKGGRDIPHDGCLRLRFFMRDASLYAFAFR